MVREWLEAFGKEVDQPFNNKQLDLAINCIGEEYSEVFAEVADDATLVDKEKLTKELCDLLWVTYQAAAFFGLPIEQAFRRVYESNMSKLGDDGKPVLREDGKILKGSNYKPANLGDLFDGGRTKG